MMVSATANGGKMGTSAYKLIGLPTVSCGGGGGEPIMLDADAGRRDNSFRRRSPRFAEIRSTKLF
jgi:hypothetical protein